MKSLYCYTDYREYLKDFFAFKKANNSHYSLRTLSEQAGFKARDYLLRVMNNSRNLSEKGIRLVSIAMHHSEKEAIYFKNLVLFNQTEEPSIKELFFKKLLEYGKQIKSSPLLDNQYSFLSNWYNVVLRSLLPMLDNCSDFRKIGRMIDPPLTESEVRKAIDLLLDQGLLTKDSTGHYHSKISNLSGCSHVQSLALSTVHKAFIDLSRRSLDIHKSEERDISGVTMSISKEGYQKIKTEIEEFRKRLMGIAANDCNEDRVYHINLHLFPLTKRKISS